MRPLRPPGIQALPLLATSIIIIIKNDLDDDSQLAEDCVQSSPASCSAFGSEVVLHDRNSQSTNVATCNTLAIDKVKADLCIKELKEF